MTELAAEGGESNGSNVTECFSLETTSNGVLHYHATVLGVIVIISILENALVLLLFARFKELRTRSVVVSMSMVVADLLFTLFYTLQVIVTTLNKRWVFGDLGCSIFGFMASALLCIRWLIVSLLCLDRFLTVRFPFSYKRRGKYILITLTTLAWVLPLLAATIPPASGLAAYGLQENQPVCLPICTSLPCRLYLFLVYTTVYILGSIVPIVLYLLLYCKARKLRTSTSLALGRLTTQVAGGVAVSQPISEQTVNRDKHATLTVVLIFAAVFITGTPAYFAQITRPIYAQQCKINILAHFIIFEFLLCAPMLTPLVIMRDSSFRRCLVKLFCCCRRTGDLHWTSSTRSPTTEQTFVYSQDSSSIANGAPPQAPSTQMSNRTSSKPTVDTLDTISELSCESFTDV